MRIAVIGAGGVGGFFGGRLAQAGHEVHFVARGEHLRAILDRGLRVRSVRGDFEVRAAASCAQAGMTAATGLPIGEIRDAPQAWSMFRRMVDEVNTVASAEGVDLGADAVDRHVRFAEQLEPDGRSSLGHDRAHGRRMELEALHGTVVRLARKHAIPAPASEAIYALLQPWALRNERAASRI